MYISSIVTAVLEHLRMPRNSMPGTVSFPKSFAIWGIIATAIFLIPAVITAVMALSAWIPILFLLLSLLGISLLLSFANCRIHYGENSFIAKNFFGFKRKYTYDQVTAIRENAHESYIYVDKHRIMVDEFAIGGRDFIKKVKQKYTLVHNGKLIPFALDSKLDRLFHGNLRSPGELLFVYILGSVLFVGILSITSYMFFFFSYTPENTEKVTASFISYSFREDGMFLLTENHQRFVIDIDETIDTAKIRRICDRETTVMTYSKKITPKNADDYYSVKAISHRGEFLLNFEETTEVYHKSLYPVIIVVGTLSLLWLGFITLSIHIGRNPHNYSKTFVRLFFKDEAFSDSACRNPRKSKK